MENNEIALEVKQYIMNEFVVLRNYTSQNLPGKVRSVSGTMVEGIVDLIWNKLSEKYPLVKSKIAIGRKTPVTVIDDDGIEIKESVDRHCFINDIFVLAIECKTYLDKCYLQRASDDFKLIKKENPQLKCLILSLEDSVKKESYDFIMNKKYVDSVYFFSDEKRNSKLEKRIYYNEERIKHEHIVSFIEYLEEFFINGNRK